ncbi:MAG: hypothetical protein Q8R15_03060 [Candidatus Micrarchaeota archaeon]|nr:hypothetical protein [Candidatus Micrarchaeota archaeon]
MKLAFCLIVTVLFLSGCTTQTRSDDSNITTTLNNTTSQNIGNDTSNQNAANDSNLPNPSDNVINQNTAVNGGASPTITTSASPSNPDRGEPFNITVTAQDDTGVQSIHWESTDTFARQPDSTTFQCNSQQSCTVTWTFNATVDGLKTITVYARDSAGLQSSRTPMEVTIQPFDARPSSSSTCGNNLCENGETTNTCSNDCPYRPFTCANAICEGGESYESCPQDCSVSNIIGSACGDGACEPGEDVSYCPSDCTSINPNCGNNICDSNETQTSCRADCEGTSGGANSCTSNSACGYKEICRSGSCVDVDCTNDGQCGSHEYCSYNNCVKCRKNYNTGEYAC